MNPKITVPSDFCKQILEFDKSIRFAGIVDKFGKILKSELRKGTVPFLSKQESILSAVQATIRMGSRKRMQAYLGKIVYSCTLYEKVKLATLPLTDHSFLLVSFDNYADHESIILKRVLPLLKQHSLQ